MPDNRQGSFRLFRVAGIDVSIHWSWFLIAVYEIQYRKSGYSSPAWNAAEYLTLFLIVLMHEFGHALACRQTGGKSDHITLWPLGGIAYVQPPPRPGALLWSIVAGPLVNLVLVPVFIGIRYALLQSGFLMDVPDFRHYLHMVALINLVLLIFNLLPIYPLDGGQILRALLWFLIGRAKSLLVACIIGVIGGMGMVAAAIYLQSIWFGILAVFAIQRCWFGFKQANVLSKLEKLPRHEAFACPECGEAPFQADKWKCTCGTLFDPFTTGMVCPQCQKTDKEVQCLSCRNVSEFEKWKVAK
ncbi:MAG: M50 family metallopeptidase [Chthoniobacteraceae bacterium]